jgi:hypothetical protein
VVVGGDVGFQAGDADRYRVAGQQFQRVAGVSPAALAGVGPVGHLASAVGLDAQFAAADEGAGARIAGGERPDGTVVAPVP